VTSIRLERLPAAAMVRPAVLATVRRSIVTTLDSVVVPAALRVTSK